MGHARGVSRHIHIDRRHHMELAWKRQMQLEADIDAELRTGPEGVVWQVRDLAHLERIHKVSGGRVVVMLAYNRSCGSCKRAIECLQQMSRQVCYKSWMQNSCRGHGIRLRSFLTLLSESLARGMMEASDRAECFC